MPRAADTDCFWRQQLADGVFIPCSDSCQLRKPRWPFTNIPLSSPSGTQVKALLDEMLEKLIDEFNIAELMAKVEERTPYVVVAFQECERMNILTSEIKRSLKELDLGLKVGALYACNHNIVKILMMKRCSGNKTGHSLYTALLAAKPT